MTESTSVYPPVVDVMGHPITYRTPETELFRQWQHARETLMIMAGCLGTLFLGISFLAAKYRTVTSGAASVIGELRLSERR